MNLLRYRIVVLKANESSVRKLQNSDDTINFRTLLIYKLESSVELPNLVCKYSYPSPSQSSKFWVLLPFADSITRRHSQAITWSMFGHTRTEFAQQFAPYPCRHLPNLGKRLCRVIIALYNKNGDMNTWSLYSCVNLEESVLGTGSVHHAFSDSVTRLYECSYVFYSAEITAAKLYSGWGGSCMGTRRTAARILFTLCPNIDLAIACEWRLAITSAKRSRSQNLELCEGKNGSTCIPNLVALRCFPASM